MTKSTSLPRVAVPLLVVFCGGTLIPATAGAFTPISGSAGGENTPLKLSSPSTTSSTSGGGASLTRTIVGLAIVIAVIWGLTWMLRRFKGGGGGGGRVPRSAGTGLESVAALTLASGRSLHLVRAGHDYLLVGSSEHGVVPIHRYSEQQAAEAGLIAPAIAQGGVLPVAAPAGVAPMPPAPGGFDPARGYAFGPGSGTLVERLREWTVRR